MNPLQVITRHHPNFSSKVLKQLEKTADDFGCSKLLMSLGRFGVTKEMDKLIRYEHSLIILTEFRPAEFLEKNRILNGLG